MARIWTYSRLFIAVAIALTFAVGCSATQGESRNDGLLTRSLELREAERAAIVGGTLELDPDRGCLLLSGKPVVWPAGTTLTGDPPELQLPGGLTARPGDTISGGGGEVPGARIRETAIRIEGDLTSALECAPADSEVVILTARGSGISVVGADRAPSSDRLAWAGELGRSSAVSDPGLVRKIDEAARASGARAIDVSVLALSRGQHVPVVTLESSNPAAYMKHRLRGFLDRIGFFRRDAYAFVELVDEDGRFAWSAGRFSNGGMVHPRPDLDQCSPIVHSQPHLQKPPPPCPAG